MTATQTNTSGLPIVQDGLLISTSPATGEEVARVPIAGPDDVAAAVERARAAAAWWAGLGIAGRRTRLLQFRSVLANQMPEIAELLHRECGKPMVDGPLETTAVLAHVGWAARNARRVLGRRRHVRQRSPRSSPPGWSTSRWAWSAPLDPGTTRRARSVCWRPTRWPPATPWSSSPASTPRA